MNILMLATSFPAYKGHVRGTFIYRLAKTLVKQGHNVKVICPLFKDSKKKREVMDGIVVRRVQYFFPKSLLTLSEGAGIPANLKASFLAKIQLPFFLISMFFTSLWHTKSCDVIHAHWVLNGFFGVALKKIFKKPLILTTRGEAVHIALKKFKKAFTYVLQNCDYVTPNNENHTELIKQLHISHVKTISNGVDTELFAPRDKKPLRKKLDIPQDKNILLFVGLLIERKGIRYLIESLPELIKKNKNIQLIVIGEGALEIELKHLAKKLKIRDYVTFKGIIPSHKVGQWMNAADIFLLPSYSEGKPNALTEAMASGMAVISTTVDGIPELVDHKKTGLLISPGSQQELLSSLNFFLSDKKRITHYGKKARQSIFDKKMTWEHCARDYVAIYKKIL